jgi:hypothetical protein
VTAQLDGAPCVERQYECDTRRAILWRVSRRCPAAGGQQGDDRVVRPQLDRKSTRRSAPHHAIMIAFMFVGSHWLALLVTAGCIEARCLFQRDAEPPEFIGP